MRPPAYAVATNRGNAPAVAALRVLIVDDNPAVRALIREIVETAGHVVADEAPDGGEAVRLVPLIRPDVVTMDLEMPVLNGVEATRRICAGNECPAVVIVSGSGSSELVGEALAVGARWHVAKAEAVGQLPLVLAGIAAASN